MLLHIYIFLPFAALSRFVEVGLEYAVRHLEAARRGVRRRPHRGCAGRSYRDPHSAFALFYACAASFAAGAASQYSAVAHVAPFLSVILASKIPCGNVPAAKNQLLRLPLLDGRLFMVPYPLKAIPLCLLPTYVSPRYALPFWAIIPAYWLSAITDVDALSRRITS